MSTKTNRIGMNTCLFIIKKLEAESLNCFSEIFLEKNEKNFIMLYNKMIKRCCLFLSFASVSFRTLVQTLNPHKMKMISSITLDLEKIYKNFATGSFRRKRGSFRWRLFYWPAGLVRVFPRSRSLSRSPWLKLVENRSSGILWKSIPIMASMILSSVPDTSSM